jgi:endonuclease YncB( thermonuclease family)
MTRDNIALSALLLGTTVISGALASVACERSPSHQVELACYNAVAVDGDTIKCDDGTHLRLNGIDAPERGTADGLIAWQVMSLSIDSFTLSYMPLKTDRYGRTVAEVFLKDLDLSCAMLASNHAEYVAKWDERGLVRRCAR